MAGTSPAMTLLQGAPPLVGLESVKKNQQVAASWNGAGGP